MNIILLQSQLLLHEIDLLLKEFPQFLFLSLSEAAYRNLGPEHWARLEILYGARLTKEELAKAHQLRWIQCPSPASKPLMHGRYRKAGQHPCDQHHRREYSTDRGICHGGNFGLCQKPI